MDTYATQPVSGSAETRPQLRRVLTRSDLVLYGLVILTPTAAYPVFGIVQQVSQGHAALSYLVAMVAMLCTAASYGKMARAFPAAGSTYTYARLALHDHVGFLAGWAMILDYVLIPLLSAVYVSITAVRLVPQVPYWAWAFLFASLITLINIRGIQVTARASRIMMLIMATSTVLFIGLAIHHVLNMAGASGLIVPTAVFDPATFSVGPLMLGAGIAALSFLGFDAVSTLAEDSRNPKDDIAFATLAVCALQAIFCFAIVYLAAVVWPASRPFGNVETAILDISQIIGGTQMFGFTTFVLLVAGVASSLTSQAGASRLLYGMGRDRVLSNRIFGYIHPKYSTPTRSIWLMGVISFVGALMVGFQLIVELVSFGALVGLILVNLSVIRHYYFQKRLRSGVQFWTNLVFPGIGTLVCSYVWMSLSFHAKLVGFAWLAIGLIYLAVRTRGFRRPGMQLELP